MEKIPVSDSLNVSEEIATFFMFLFQNDRPEMPRMSLAEIAQAKMRPGLDSDVLATSVIGRFPEIGIPVGPLVGGSPNVMENFVRILCDEIVSAIQNDMRVDIALDPGAVVTATGGNAGGPVQVVGSTTALHTGVGVGS